ncbi:TIM barrel protein [Saccharibacillus kuerlensis]|uniref:Hydroxypyruvate isomerase n=1 Tax=Saccharibacillus kuerlensis TaxID=459527 RepID=A0ABQ2L9R2_9BACL|nr:TIM barrel protein [Saccharibacillus kuerlensis]GGO07951.1 hydroxypyruvate isomerase [Saccharibacillus kuerlensis]
MKLSYNTETLFDGRSIYEALPILHDMGAKAIEFWSWADKDLQRIKDMCQEFRMDVASIVLLTETMLEPEGRTEALEEVERAAEAAVFLGAPTMVQSVGFEVEGKSRNEMRESLIEGLKAAVPLLEKHNVTVAIEPMNTIRDKELSGYFLNKSEEAFQIVEEVDHPLVKVCYDFYHVQIMEGNVIARMQNWIHRIGHIQAAGVPGRNELFAGELNYDRIFDAIKQTNYDGYVGIEYFPTHDPIGDLKEIHGKHHTG